jgi:hypothetical protein
VAVDAVAACAVAFEADAGVYSDGFLTLGGTTP